MKDYSSALQIRKWEKKRRDPQGGGIKRGMKDERLAPNQKKDGQDARGVTCEGVKKIVGKTQLTA
jgi:hypothetical protein